MKKTLLTILMCIPLLGQAQNIFSFGFDGTTAAMITAGWARTNQSTSPSATVLWSNATYAPVASVSTATPANAFMDMVYTTGQACPAPNGQAGGTNSFAVINYASTTSNGSNATISNWLISPAITVQNGDVISFYTRKGTSGTTDFPDRLEVRMSTAAVTVVPSAGTADVGSFTTLGVSVNPTLVAGFVYPKVWTQYSFTVTGVPTLTTAKIAFRYFVTSGGVNGANSDIIGIDTFSVDRPLSAASFFSKNFAIYPNPADNVLNLSSKTNTAMNSVQIVDLNGRVVKNVNVKGMTETEINVSDLNAGMYFVEVTSDEGKSTAKFIKR